MSSEAVRSPCIRLCRIDEATKLCAGCQRRIDEIARWSTLTEDERRMVLARVARRRAAALA